MDKKDVELMQAETWQEAINEARSSETLDMALVVISELRAAHEEKRPINSNYTEAVDFLIRLNNHIRTEYEMDATALLSGAIGRLKKH